MASALSWTSAAKIASREMHSSRGKFLFVLISVAIGVAALTGVRGFSASFRTTLLLRARSIMAADLSARMFQQPTPDEQKALDYIRTSGVQSTTVTEMLSMASSPKSPDPILVSLKAIDPALYPFYGEIELAPGLGLRSAVTASSIAVGDDLLLRLNLHIGDQLKLGRQLFRIAAVVVNEPDRISGTFAAGPRVLISRDGLESTGLLTPGNRANERFLFKMPLLPGGRPVSDAAVADLKNRLEKVLPEAQITDYRETNPALTDGLDRATSLLSLMSLVALVLGAVGVAMAMRAHLQQRLDTIAIMKSLGARSSQIIKIYLLQTLLLGLAGGVLGVLGGVGVQLAFPAFLAKLINIPTDLHLQPGAILVGLTAGILTTLMFTLPPLLDIRTVRPSLILRRATESEGPTGSLGLWSHFLRRVPWIVLAAAVTAISALVARRRWPGHAMELVLEGVCLLGAAAFGPWLKHRARSNPAQVIAFVLILGGLAAIATTLSDSAQVGRVFSIGLILVLLVLLVASAAVLAGLRWFLNRTRLHLHSSVRHGLANLYRPGNPSAALLAALGMGVMMMVTIFLMQQAIVTELHITSGPNMPNVFLVDIASSELAGMHKLLKSQHAVSGEPEFLPVVSSRVEQLNGVPASEAHLTNFPRRMLRSVSLTWSDTIPDGTTVVSGSWWKPGDTRPQIAIAQRQAERLGLKLGSTVTFAAQDSNITATVVALTRSNGQHIYSRADVVLPHAVLQSLPAIWYGAVHVDPTKVSQVQRSLYLAYPTVTVINAAQVFETVRAVVIQITYIVQFLAAFSIFAGVVILASSIAGTRYRRIREVVVLKTLGATRGRIATIFSIEFAVLGLVAGVVGLVFANLITRTLLHQLNVAYRLHLFWNVAALLLTMALAVLTGWVASHRVLGQKPLEVLREE